MAPRERKNALEKNVDDMVLNLVSASGEPNREGTDKK